MKIFKWIKEKINKWKFDRKYKKRMEELRKRDPFVYNH